MTTSTEHPCSGPVANAIARWDDDKHAVREQLAELAALPTCQRCNKAKATERYAHLDVCEPCWETFLDFGATR